MKNEEKYHFNDFTFIEYEKLLNIAKENYIFRGYTEINESERYILWRHDIDFSVHKAYKLAKIEKENNVIATYFIHLHSEFYNLLEPETISLVKKIIELGHHIGLHFDPHFYGICDEFELDKYIIKELEILEFFLNTKIRVFSFHNTNPFIMNCKKDKYGGLINTYSDYFQNNIGYCSDSYGIWRFRRLREVLETADNNKLQVLTHPELWDEKVLSPIERVYKCIDGRTEKVKSNYIKFLKSNGREAIDW